MNKVEPQDFHTWKREQLAELLQTAIDLFEMEPDCSEVNSDAWVWLHRAQEALNG
jgi:hypothetical protein